MRSSSPTGRRAILRDREAFPVFLDAVKAVEPAVAAAVVRVRREVDAQTADRLAETLRRVFARVLRELSDLDNPMRSPTGSEADEGALFAPQTVRPGGADEEREDPGPPAAPELQRPPDEPGDGGVPPEARPEGRRARALPSVAPDPEPGEARSRFDPAGGVVLYNDRHADQGRRDRAPGLPRDARWPRSTSSTTRVAATRTSWPRSSCGCSCGSAGTCPRRRP